MRIAILSTALAGALFIAPLTAGLPAAAMAQPAVSGPSSAAAFQAAMRHCRRVLPIARRLVGLPQETVRARFRAPRGVIVRYCAICTRDFRPNRLTFGLDERGIVRGASCG
ncbi:hypothetical protein ACJ4V0_08410 [Phreatobacter sp. HK31-P]